MLLKIIILVVFICLAEATFKTCSKLLDELADKQTRFIHCVTTNSAPVTMCTICIDHYTDLQKAYDLIATNPNCTAMYFDKDRINMVSSTNAVLMGLWTKAYCDDCSNNNNSIVFQDKNDTLDNCLTSHKKDPCEECQIQYMDLNSFYINLDQHNNGEVCYDLQDSMNRTRNNWSKVLKCCRREYNMTLFTITLSIISCLPFLFYGGTYLLTKRQERNHGILNDEDPLFNAPSASSSAATSTLNINNPSSSRGNNTISSSTTTPATKDVAAVTVSLPKTTNKAGFKILNEELVEEEDDAPIAHKKVFNIMDDDDDESSDDENIAEDLKKHYKKN